MGIATSYPELQPAAVAAQLRRIRRAAGPARRVAGAVDRHLRADATHPGDHAARRRRSRSHPYRCSWPAFQLDKLKQPAVQTDTGDGRYWYAGLACYTLAAILALSHLRSLLVGPLPPGRCPRLPARIAALPWMPDLLKGEAARGNDPTCAPGARRRSVLAPALDPCLSGAAGWRAVYSPWRWPTPAAADRLLQHTETRRSAAAPAARNRSAGCGTIPGSSAWRWRIALGYGAIFAYIGGARS